MPILVANHSVSPHHYINGARVNSAESFEVFSPIDQAVLGRVAQASPSQVGDAVSAAHLAFPS
jgi:acyl-CoA reductase-like NAD-dependent aldehyde dehydrogenase